MKQATQAIDPNRQGWTLHPIGRPCTRPDAVAADKAYSSRGNRAYLRQRGVKAVIPDMQTRRPTARSAGLAFHFDKTSDNYLAGLHLRGAVMWIRSLHPA